MKSEVEQIVLENSPFEIGVLVKEFNLNYQTITSWLRDHSDDLNFIISREKVPKDRRGAPPYKYTVLRA